MLGAVKVGTDSLEPIIVQMSEKYGVPTALIKATIKQESNWNVSASRFEAHKTDASWGLMQILLATAKETLGNNELSITQLLNPSINIETGTKFLAKQLARYKGNMMDAIAAYNAGSAKKDENGVYINNAYVQAVYGNYVMYKTLESVASPAAVSVGLAAIIGVGLVLATR